MTGLYAGWRTYFRAAFAPDTYSDHLLVIAAFIASTKRIPAAACGRAVPALFTFARLWIWHLPDAQFAFYPVHITDRYLSTTCCHSDAFEPRSVEHSGGLLAAITTRLTATDLVIPAYPHDKVSPVAVHILPDARAYAIACFANWRLLVFIEPPPALTPRHALPFVTGHMLQPVILVILPVAF